MKPALYYASGLTPAALAHCFALGIGSAERGVLSRLAVVQAAGDLDGFTYALYCSGAACPPGPSPTPAADAACFNVVPTVAVAAGQSTLVGTWPNDGVNHLWLPFSTAPDGRKGALRCAQQLYLLITCATGYAGKTFSASVTVDDACYT